MKTSRTLPLPFKLLHWLILANLLLQVFYGAYMVFVVAAPDGVGPLWATAREMPFELMVTRRLYAIETWIAIGTLSLYAGLTEIFPRLAR